MLHLDPQFAQDLDASDPFDTLWSMDGTVYRRAKGRKTLRFSCAGKFYFLKRHSGIGWLEIVKNWLQLKRPVVGASNEWQAIERLHSLGVPTMKAVAFGSRGLNPARRKSFIVTEELSNTLSLEDMCKDHPELVSDPRLRRRLVECVAAIAKTLHENGVCHRDFYLCHFLLRQEPRDPPHLSLIDLHRAQIQKPLSRRWIVKDLAGLYYSTLAIGLDRRDLLRFIRHYSGQRLKFTLRTERGLWSEVEQRARRMFDKLGPAF